MKISDAMYVTHSAWENDPSLSIMWESEPGSGKTEAAFQLTERMEGYEPLLIRPSDRDSSDILGIPDLGAMAEQKVVQWVPPVEMHMLDENNEFGKYVFIIDELSDANVAMQNVLCGVINDRKTANITLHPDVRVLCTGNRVKDKSGANRIVTKLGNRMMKLPITVDRDDWKRWAFNNGISPALIAFIHLRDEWLSKFDPQNFSNPTPRSWAKLDRALDFDKIPLNTYMIAAAGLVGEAAAGEYTNFLKLFPQMPNLDTIIADPENAPIPTDPSLIYALCTAFVRRINFTTIDPIFKYMARDQFPKDFRAMCINDIRVTDDLAEYHEHRCITEVELATQQQDFAH